MIQTKEKRPGTAATVQSAEPKVQDQDTTIASGCKDPVARVIIEPEMFQAERLASMLGAIHTAAEYGPFALADYIPALDLLASLMETHAMAMNEIFNQFSGEAAQ